MHKTFLCDASPFFRAALEGHFKETTDGFVKLPEDEPDTIDRFLGWLYWEDYDIKQLVKDETDTECWSAIIDDHVFADKVQVEAFQNHIVDQVLKAWQSHDLKVMSLGAVLKIYTDTPDTSSLRRLAVAMYEYVSPDWFRTAALAKGLENVPQFAAELIQKLAGSTRNRRNYMALKAEEFYDQRSENDNATLAGMETV